MLHRPMASLIARTPGYHDDLVIDDVSLDNRGRIDGGAGGAVR